MEDNIEENTLETLKSIGLTPGEAKVYTALIGLGTSTVGPIIEKSGVSASKVYIILDRLANKGLVSVITKDGSKRFIAADPTKIMDYLDHEKEKIEKHKRNAEKIIPSLKLKRDSTSKFPPVEIAKGMKGAEMLYDEIYTDLKAGDEYIATSGNRISFKFKHYWFKQNQLLVEKGIPQYLIYENYVWYGKDPKFHQRKKRKLYFPKILPDKYKNLPTLLVIGDKSIISDIDDDGKVFTVLIRNKNMSDSLKKLLKVVRDAAEYPEGFIKKEPD
ncbi:MAG: helix-turn-helix domain-containing protein [Candidatus Woesearchaeota archaeon]